jgi:hypothetical protein
MAIRQQVFEPVWATITLREDVVDINRRPAAVGMLACGVGL